MTTAAGSAPVAGTSGLRSTACTLCVSAWLRLCAALSRQACRSRVRRARRLPRRRDRSGWPFGSNTVGPLSQGFGVAALLGYALHPNFGLDAFGHCNNTQATFSASASKPSTNEGSVTLWGFEARGMVGGEGLVKAWASLGLAFGSGKLDLSGASSGANVNVQDTVDFTTMPVIAFGAEAKVGDGIRLGPQVRWYLTGVDSACQNATASNGTATASQSRCATAIDNQTPPDILFLGFTLGYHQH